MTHPLINQLRFTRSEFKRGLIGITDAEAQQRFMPMNCLSWNIGHLAWQEQRYWLMLAQNKTLLPWINEQFANGAPASTPALDAVWAAYNEITAASDAWLDTVTTEMLNSPVIVKGRPSSKIWGSMLLRMVYHYWYHNGENQAIRQMLGHRDLGQFVGNIDDEAPYRP